MATIYLIIRSHCHSYRIIGSSLIYLNFFSLKLQTLLFVLYIQLFLEQNSKIKGKLFSSFSWFQCQRVQKTTKIKSISIQDVSIWEHILFFFCQLGGWSDLEFVTKVTSRLVWKKYALGLNFEELTLKKSTFLCNLPYSGKRCCSFSQNNWSLYLNRKNDKLFKIYE